MNDKLIKSKQSKQLTTATFSFKSIEELENYGEKIAKSGFTPLKTKEAVVAAILMGRELGLEPMISANNIVAINGRATLGIHLITSLLLRAGVVIEKVRDYEPCVPFAMKGDGDKPALGTDGKPTIVRIGFIDEEPRAYELKSKTIVDSKTVIKLTRQIKQPDGTFVKTSVIQGFSWNDAIIAKLSIKDSWTNYPGLMCYNRCLAFASRAIADDVLLGMYETSEIADVEDIPYNVEEGTVTILNNTKSSNTNTEVVKEDATVVN